MTSLRKMKSLRVPLSIIHNYYVLMAFVYIKLKHSVIKNFKRSLEKPGVLKNASQRMPSRPGKPLYGTKTFPFIEIINSSG